MQNSTPLKTHPSRALQLKTIADSWDCTVTEAIERMITETIMRYDLLDMTPGFEIVARSKSVLVQIGDEPILPLRPVNAAELSTKLEALEAGMVKGFRGNYADIELTFYQQGRAIAFTYKKGDHVYKTTFTRRMIGDLSRQFQIASLKALSTEAA